jgi:hypothetical protein
MHQIKRAAQHDVLRIVSKTATELRDTRQKSQPTSQLLLFLLHGRLACAVPRQRFAAEKANQSCHMEKLFHFSFCAKRSHATKTAAEGKSSLSMHAVGRGSDVYTYFFFAKEEEYRILSLPIAKRAFERG